VGSEYAGRKKNAEIIWTCGPSSLAHSFVHLMPAFFFFSQVSMSPPLLANDSYLVDPASSHMLVSKIKPCMSKYKQLCTVKLRMAH
jgi:hypothetical protein